MLNHWLKGKNDYPVRCELLQPIYEGEGATKKAISWQPYETAIYCKEAKPFQTTELKEMGRRKKQTSGTLETASLKQDEINIDWKIIYDGKEFMIESLTQEDNHEQQTMLKKPIITTILNVRC